MYKAICWMGSLAGFYGCTFAEDDMAANQVKAAAACKAFEEAQIIYHRTDHDGDGVLEYAQSIHGGMRVFSAPLEAAKLPKPTPGQQKQITDAIKDLGSNDFDVRVAAVRSLKGLGTVAYASLEKELKSTDAQVAAYAKQIVDEIAAKSSATDPGDGFGLLFTKTEGYIPLVDKAFGEAECPIGIDPAKVTPRSGYLFRVLKGQGASATGGKRNYLVRGNMNLGFGMLAFPKEYGKSGKACFIVGSAGTVFVRDFGDKAKTDEFVKTAIDFDPTIEWVPAGP